MSIVNIIKEPEYYYPAGMAEQDGLMTYQEFQKLDSIPTPSNIVTKSSTAGLLKNDGTVDSNSYVKKSDLEEIKTATGNPITLTDAIAGNALEVSAEIVASQDLHGYDKPWVGGSGKNKYDLSALVRESPQGGISFAANSDGSLSITGGTTSGEFFPTLNYRGVSLAPPLATNTNYIFSIGQGKAQANLNLEVYYKTTSSSSWTLLVSQANVDSVSFTTPSTLYDIWIRVEALSGRIINTTTLYPMVRLASVTDATFEPYSNICPISGFSSVAITNVDAESHTATVTVALGSTVYGGSLDLTSGELTVTHAVDTITVTGTIDSYTNITYGTLSKPSDSAEKGSYDWHDTITDKYKLYNDNWNWDDASKINEMFMRADGNNYWIGFAKGTTLANMQSAVGNLTVCYELATPTTTTLTAEQLALVKGQNTLTCNSGDMSITYKASGLDALNELLDNLQDRLGDVEDDIDNLAISELTDVAISSPTNGQVMTFDSVTGKWKNQNPSGGEVYFDQTATLSTSTTTTVTFTESEITTSSVIDIAVSEWGLTPEDVTVTTGVCTVTMPKVSTARSITVRIYVR